MKTSILDLFKIGIGPSSSHTVGPMRAAREYGERLSANGLLDPCHVPAQPVRLKIQPAW